MATLDNLVDTQLGQYQIISKLGQGGMATVFKAHEQSLNRVVALKVLHPSLAENEEYIKRFKREAQSAAKLNHPNIVHIYAIGEDRGHHFFAMEMIKGDSLADFKRSGQKLSTARMLAITRQIASGLGAAHEAGLVHRDIKPSNIMLLADGTVKVADFGIAQVTGGETKLTMDGAVIGTPEYLSPEQCEGRPLDGRSDIYSLGVTLYELLSGKTPYHADTPVSMLMKIVKGEYPPLGSIVPDIPTDIESLVKRMMATRPEDRFATCQELITAIDALAPAPGTNATPAPAVEPLLTTVNPETRISRTKGKGWLVIAALLIVAVGVGAAMYFEVIPTPWHPKTSETIQPLGALSAGGDPATPPADGASSPAEDGTGTPDALASSGQPETQQFQENQTQPDGSQPVTESPQARFEAGQPADGSALGNTAQPQSTPEDRQMAAAAPTGGAEGSRATNREPARAFSPYLHLLAKEENEYSEIILTSIEEKLIKRGIEVIRGEPDGQGPFMALIVSFRTAGASSLEFYGKTAVQTQAFLTLSLLDMPSRRNLSAPQKQEVLFTELNMNENIEEAIDTALAGFNWQEIRQKRRQVARGRIIRQALNNRRAAGAE